MNQGVEVVVVAGLNVVNMKHINNMLTAEYVRATQKFIYTSINCLDICIWKAVLNNENSFTTTEKISSDPSIIDELKQRGFTVIQDNNSTTISW